MEFDSLDRCAAYVATRGALEAAHLAVATWPEPLAELARRAATDAVLATADGLAHDRASAARRRALRGALAAALELAASCDVARATGQSGAAFDEAARRAHRAIALLALLLHACAETWD